MGLSRRRQTAVAGVALVLGLAVSWLVPLGAATPDPSCAPDELAHFTYISALADGRFGSWPEVDSRMAMFTPGQYALQAAGLKLARAGMDDAAWYRSPPRDRRLWGFPGARLGSVLLGVLAVICLADAATTVTGSQDLGAAAGLVAALYPQRFFVSGYLNNDVFTFACGALLLAAVVRWAGAGERDSGLIAVAVACGLLATAKPSGYALLPPTLIWVGWAAARRRISRRAAVSAGLASAALALPMLGWNAIRNGGDALGVSVYKAFVASDSWRGSPELVLPANPVWVFMRSLSSSSFMKLGNQSVGLPALLYLPWLLLLSVGLGVAVARARGGEPKTLRLAAWLAAGAGLSFAALLYQCFLVDFAPQGRYVLLPIVVLTLVALWGINEGLGHRWRQLTLVYFAIVALWSLILLWQQPCGPGVVLPVRVTGSQEIPNAGCQRWLPALASVRLSGSVRRSRFADLVDPLPRRNR